MKKSMQTVLCFSLLIIMNGFIYAQNKREHQFILYMNTPSVTKIATDKSDTIQIGYSSWMADMGMEFKFYGILSLSAGVGIGSVKDNNTFTQNTTLGEKKSSFNTYSYNIKMGIWYPEIEPFETRDLKIAPGFSGGIAGFRGKREIDDCIDCREEKFRFKGGMFIEPEINFFFFQDLIGLGTSYRYYFGDIDLLQKIVLLKLMIRLNISQN